MVSLSQKINLIGDNSGSCVKIWKLFSGIDHWLNADTTILLFQVITFKNHTFVLSVSNLY